MKKAITIILSIILILTITLPAAAISSIAVKSINLNISKIELGVGQSSDLKVTFSPSNTTQKQLTYVTDNQNVANIDATGKITGVAVGTTTITVYTFNKLLSKKCNVTVSQKSPLKYRFSSYTTVIPKAPQYSFQAKLIKERFNIDLKFDAQPMDMVQGKQKLKILAAANVLPDIFWMSNPNEYPEMIDNGQILEVTDLLKNYGKNILATTQPIVISTYSYSKDGKLYGIPAQDRPATTALYVRKDWLQNLNLKVPTTIEQFHDMLKAFTFDDPDKNGMKDTYGYGERNVWYAMFQPVFQAYGIHPWFFQEYNGKIYYGLTHPETAKVLQILKGWYKEGIIDPEFITSNTDQWFAKLGLGKFGVCVAGVYSQTKVNGLVQAVKPTASMIKITPPVGPDGKAGLTAYGGIINTVAISTKAKSPERIVEMLDWMSTDEGIGMMHYGIEGKDYKLNEGGGVTRLISVADQERKGLLDLNGRFFNIVRPIPSISDKFANAADVEGFKIAEKYAVYDVLQGYNFKARNTMSPNLDNDTLLKGMLSIIAGKEDVSEWQKYVDAWYKGGGTALIEEATQAYNKKKTMK